MIQLHRISLILYTSSPYIKFCKFNMFAILTFEQIKWIFLAYTNDDSWHLHKTVMLILMLSSLFQNEHCLSALCGHFSSSFLWRNFFSLWTYVLTCFHTFLLVKNSVQPCGTYIFVKYFLSLFVYFCICIWIW